MVAIDKDIGTVVTMPYMGKGCSGELRGVDTNRVRAYRLLAYLLMVVVVIIMGSGAGCLPSELHPPHTLPPWESPMPTTPTPTEESTPTRTEEEVMLTPTSVLPVTVELSGKVDSAGILLEDVELISADGLAVLYLGKGTKVVDASSQPLDSITVTARPSEALPPWEYALIGLAYDFSPRGARFDPPALLTISYDPSLIPPHADKNRPQMGYFEEAESGWTTWTWLEVTADLDIHCVAAEIEHLGTFIVSSVIWYVPLS